jgi:hypothetical protein
MILTSLLDLQLWLLFQAMISAVMYAWFGFGGLFGSLLGSFIYLMVFQ